MAKYSNVVEYNVVTDVDTSGIVKLQNELTKLKQSLKFDKNSFSQLGFDDAKIDKSIRKVNQLQTAITAAFNPKIGTIDLSKLNASLQKEHTSLQMIVKDWEQMGTRGTMAISNLSNALLSMNKGAMNVNTTLSKIANTFSNTVRWGITASIFQEMMSSVQGAVSYMKDLDESLTNIQMVTNSSKEDMRELAQYANNAAQALGSTTTDYTNAVKVFVQEGFSESESKQYANLSTKLANVSEQNTATTSDQITAYRNAFQLDYAQTVEAMDKVANVANNTASNVNELMTASQRAASVAQAVGSSQDSFLAAIATIESVTRQSAEEIGNGLKTIYQRFADIKTGKTAEDGVDYGQYAKALQSVGVDVLDAAGQFKGMDQILKELQEIWSGLDDTMKIAVGEKVAGKFQYNRFAALMNNPEYYQKALGATQNASGMMDQMNEHYMNSIEGRLNTLQAAGEQVMSSLFDQDSVEPIIGQVTELVNGLNDIVTAVGGLNSLLPALSAIMLRTFSTQIAGSVANIASSIGSIASNTVNANSLNTSVELLGLKNYSQSGGSSVAGKLVSGVAGSYDQLSVSTQEKIRDLSQQIVELEEQKQNALKEQEQFFKAINENAIEEKNIIDQQIQEYAEEIKLIREKQKAGQVTVEDSEREAELYEVEIPKLREKAKVYRDISKEVNSYITKLANGEKLNSNVINRLSKMKEQADRLGISINNLEELMERLDVASNNLNIGDKMVDAAIKSATLESNINNMIKGLSGITSISFGFSMISETFRVLGDETSSLKEKLDAVAINGLMGITMLVPGIMQSVSAVRELSKAWEAWRIQQAAALAVEELFANKQALNIALRGNNIKTIALESLEQGKLNKEKMIGKLIEAGYSESMAKQIATKTINLGIDEASEKVTTRRIIQTGIATAVTDTLSAALQRLGVSAEFAEAAAGPLGIALAAITAIAAVTFIAVNQMAEAEEKRKQQLQEQVDTSNQVIQKLNETKIAYDEAYDNYKRTGEASEDLKNKSIELAEALKIEGAQALANAGMYDELNGKIQQAAINQREYNNALLEQQIKGLDKQNSVYNYDWQNVAYGADGSLVGTTPSVSVTDSTEVIANKRKNIEETEKEIATIREQLLYLDNTSEGYIEQKQALEDLIKTKQEYLVQNELDENQQKELDNYKQRAENSVNIAKDTGLFDNVRSFQQIIDMLKQDSSINEYLSMLGEDEANAWIQSFVEQILADKPDILKAFHLAITPDQNAKYDFSDDILKALGATYDELTGSYKGGFQLNDEQAKLLKQYEFNSEIKIGDEIVKFGDYLKNQGIKSVEDLAKALADSNGELFEFSQNLSDIQGAVSLNDLDYEYEKSDKTTANTEDYNKQLDKLTEQAAEAYDIDLEDIIDQAKAFREELNLTEGAARDLAVQNQRMTRGIDALYDGWEKWLDILQNSNHAAKDYIDASQEATKAIADLVGASDDLELSNEFFESAENLEDIALAAEGDIEAINRLGVAVGKDLIEAMEAVSREASGLDFSDADTEQAYANMVNQFYDAKSTVMAGLDELQAQINNLGIGENVYSILGGEEWVNALNTMAEQTHMSVEQMNSLLNSIGVKADVTTIDVPQKVKVPVYTTQETVEEIPSGVKGGPTTYRKTSYTVQTGTEEVDGVISVAQINTGSEIGTPPSITYVGNGPVSRSSTPAGRSKGGGGGKSPKSGSGGSGKDTKPKDKDKTEWDYLTDITNDLDRAAAVIEKLSKLEDRLYGSSRVSQIKKLQKEYKNYIGLLEQEVKLAENHAQLLRNNAYDENGNLTINGYGYRAGVGSLQFDAQNNLENGKEIEARLVDRVNAAIDDYNAHRNADDASYYEERVSLAQKDHEGFLKALSEYESTLGKIEDGQSQIQDYKEKIQDATDEIVDAIQDGIEDVLEAIDNQRDFNKMYRDWMQGGSDYSHLGNQHRYYAEGLEGLLSPGQSGVSIFDMQLQSLQDRIEDFKDIFDEDSQNADDEKLSEQAAFENLQEATKNIMGSLEKAVDYYDSLLETVQDASDKMDELIDNRLDEFNNLEDYLDTRLDQLKLLFGDKSYEQQAQLYNEKIAVNMEKMVSINTAIEAKQATVKALEGLEESGKELSTEERKVLQDARNKVTSLQKEQLDTESQLLQDIANRLGNQVNAELDTAINNLFGGEDIDWLMQQWELSTRFSEQYLDDYNRAFELQKLQIKYQELLNDTQATSAMAQQRISAQMTQQLKYLREKNHLSEYDVEYAEKKLEILQRELALEDARNNKSQMRLQRNAAGNYDFVYAADEDAINDAKMALLNAQQEAYNLSKQMYKEIYDGALKLSKELKQMVFDVATDASLTTEQQAERIKWIMENTSEYLGNASVELGEVSVNLYNDIADAEQLIAEENLGNLADIFEIMRAQSKATQESVGQDLSDGRDNAINAASDTFGNIQGLSSGTQKAISGDFENVEGSLNTMLSNSYTNVNGTIAKIVQGSSERSRDIIGVIGNIDKNFGLSVGNMLTNTKSIDETFKGAFDNIAGDKEDSYLNQYKNKTTEVLKQAGDEYNTFTEQSIDYATEQLGLLRQATQDWNSDLDTLKQMIKDNADEIKGWKTEIGLAMTASKDFITESNNLQTAFGEVGTMAMIAGSMFDDFGEAAYGAGAAVDTMSHDIEGAYYAIRDAAEAAAQAYDDMAWSASNAAREADSARIAAENAQAALNAVGIANNLASGARNIINNTSSWLNGLFKGGSKKVSYNTNYLWDGFTYSQWDTGGYTGTWTDQGIDDKSGKWAILHQKELVLNADDTKNMLSAVEIVRDIMSNINSLPSLGKITAQNNLTDTIEQRVEINATFPGVTEAIQIKQALEQIADNAYQVANKYKY